MLPSIEAWLFNTHSSAVVDSSSQNAEPCFPLLSLPQLSLAKVISFLDRKDKRSLAGVCRSLAVAVNETWKDTQVTVTPSTGWEGLRKVLETRTITCKSMRLEADAEGIKRKPDWFAFWRSKPNAVDVLLAPGSTIDCSFPGIQQLYLKAQPLPCILPTRLASILPDLEELHFDCNPGHYTADAHLQPIPYCSSLRKLRCKSFVLTPALPSKYHTSEDLRRQLPNVVSLDIQLPPYLNMFEDSDVYHNKTRSFVSRLVDAWGHQLTELVLDTYSAPAQLQHCTSLQTLIRRVDVEKMFANFLPQSLTHLEVHGGIRESDLQAILQLPYLKSFEFDWYEGELHHDWSKHPCSWQKLKLIGMPMVHLAKLPLHSLKGQGCLNIQRLKLPDPLLPDSLINVQHAAQCVQDAGITIEGLTGWDLAFKHDHGRVLACKDEVLAGMIRAASKVVRPPDSYYFQPRDEMPRYPQATTELLKWLSPVLQELNTMEFDLFVQVPLWFWKALQCCSEVVKIVLPIEQYMPLKWYLRDISAAVLQAAEQLVTVTGRPVKLVFCATSRKVPEHIHARMYPSADVFREKLQEELPDSVILKECAWSIGHESYENLVVILKPMKLAVTETLSD